MRKAKGNKIRVQFIMEEFPVVGHLESVIDAIGLVRGYGILFLFIVQTVAQLRKCFPKGQEEIAFANATQIYFGINSQETAVALSERLGTQTISVDSGNTSKQRSHSFGRGRGQEATIGNTASSTDNWAPQGRKLATPDELMTMSPRIAVTLHAGMSPVLTRLIRHYEEPKLFRRAGWLGRQWKAMKMLLISTIICAGAIGAAALLTEVAASESHQNTNYAEPTSF